MGHIYSHEAPDLGRESYFGCIFPISGILVKEWRREIIG
jgi:hypothetical protein